MARKVFVNPAGQRDNLGDSILRRPYLDALRQGGELHVLVGTDVDYASGLGLNPNDHVYTSRLRWLANAIASCTRRSAAFAINAGEVIGTPEERKRSLWQSILARIARKYGCPVVMAGVSVRPGTPVQETRLHTLARLAGYVSWRDAESRDSVGIGSVVPDWAFAIEGGGLGTNWADRTLIAVSMRGDRPSPPDEWFDDCRAVAEVFHAALVVVVQVRRDYDRAVEIAERLGAEVVAWEESKNHDDQERVVREVYGRCIGVISDRIHALIIGSTEGAVPLGTSTARSDKLTRTFAPVTSLPVSPDGSEEVSRWSGLIDSRSQYALDLGRARAAVDEAVVGLRAAIQATSVNGRVTQAR